MSASAATGAWNKKIARQLNSSVSTPPSAGPIAAPIVPASAQIPIACSSLRRMPGEHGYRARERERRAEAFDDAPDDEHFVRAGHAAQQRRRREDGESGSREDVPAHPALERDDGERAEDDRDVVGGDRLRHRDDRHVERAVEIRQRQDDDRGVGGGEPDGDRDNGDESRVTGGGLGHHRAS